MRFTTLAIQLLLPILHTSLPLGTTRLHYLLLQGLLKHIKLGLRLAHMSHLNNLAHLYLLFRTLLLVLFLPLKDIVTHGFQLLVGEG